MCDVWFLKNIIKAPHLYINSKLNAHNIGFSKSGFGKNKRKKDDKKIIINK